MKQGFTFTELMVIISIIGIFTIISFPYYQDIRKTLTLDRAVVKLAQDVRKAQEMSMSAFQFNGSVPPGGYGIYFDINEPDHYILFADMDEDNLYDTSVPCGAAGSECVEDIYLEKGVELEECGPTAGICSHLSFCYKAPDPCLHHLEKISGGGWGSFGDGTFAYIKLLISGKEKTVNLNRSGLVDID